MRPGRRPRRSRAPGEANGLEDWRPRCTASSAPWTWRPISTSSGSRPRAAASRRRFSTTASLVVAGEDAEVEAREGPSLTPPARVENATRAPRQGRPRATRRRCAHATPSVPRAASSATSSSCSLPPSRSSSFLRSAALRPRPTAGPSGTPAASRSAPSISRRDAAPLEHVPVEPLGPHRSRQRELDRVSAARPPRPLPKGARGLSRRGHRRLPAARGPRRGSRPPPVRTPPTAGRRAAGDAAGELETPGARTTSPHSPSSSSARTASGSSAIRLSSARGDRRRPCRGRPRHQPAVSGSGSKPNRAA